MSKTKGPTKRKPTPRTLDGIPGTVEPGFRERPIIELPVPPQVIAQWDAMGADASKLRRYRMGACNIMVGHEPLEGDLLWHLTISTPSRHPTWDEIKVARYRLLPHDVCMAMMLPHPRWYVNVPAQDHVMQLWEIRDPSEPWRIGN